MPVTTPLMRKALLKLLRLCYGNRAYFNRMADSVRPFSVHRRRLESCSSPVFARNKQKLVVGAIFVYFGAVSSPAARLFLRKYKQKLAVGAIFVYLGRRLGAASAGKNKQKHLDILIFVYLCSDMARKMGIVTRKNKQKQSVPRVSVYFY